MRRRTPTLFALALSVLCGFTGCGGMGTADQAARSAAVPAEAGARDTTGATDFSPPADEPSLDIVESDLPRILPSDPCRRAWRAEIPRGGHRFHPDSPRETYAEYLSRLDRADCHKDWTILVYMAADNDLNPYALWDLYEMEAGYRSGLNRAGSTLKTDVLVQLDTASPAEGVRRLHLFQRSEPFDPRLGIDHFRAMGADGIRSPVVQRLPESQGESHERRFRRFLEWGMRAYPSKRYMVVIWGHGQGWRGDSPAEGGARFGGIGFDDSDGGYLSIPAVRRSLESVSGRVLDGRPIDVYAADSCLMQMLEVAHEIAPHARFIVGSTQVQNYLGLPYRRVLHEINTGAFAGLRRQYPAADEGYLAAKMIPRLFRASFGKGGLQARHAPNAVREVTMSAISSSELEHLFVPALERFAASLSAYLREDPMRAVHLQHLAENAPKFMGGAQDLGIFLGLLKSRLIEEAAGGPLLGDLDELRSALDRVVLAYAHGTRFEDPEDPFFLPGWFRAVSLWLPVRAPEYLARIGDFRSSALYRRLPAWEEWMKIIYGTP